jgi:hypothetical protein
MKLQNGESRDLKSEISPEISILGELLVDLIGEVFQNKKYLKFTFHCPCPVPTLRDIPPCLKFDFSVLFTNSNSVTGSSCTYNGGFFGDAALLQYLIVKVSLVYSGHVMENLHSVH